MRISDWSSDVCSSDLVLVRYLIDEARISAVFKQSADEIGEQILVIADGRIDAHRRWFHTFRDIERRQRRIKRLAHAMQALELVAVGSACHNADRGDAIGVMRRKGGKQDVASA